MDSKNFYYSVEFFSRDILLATSGLFCSLFVAVIADAQLRGVAQHLFETMTWIQLVMLVGAFGLFSVSWSFFAYRCFNMLPWAAINVLFSRSLDYRAHYIEHKEKIGELYDRAFGGDGVRLVSYDTNNDSDLRLRMNVLLHLVQQRLPHGYIYLQRLWGVQSMLGSMAFTSIVISVVAPIFGKWSMSFASLVFALLLVVSYAGIVRSTAKEELKVLGVMLGSGNGTSQAL